ncbi:MAG TPA: hypothetical protein VFG71_06535 [Nitrospiraceae bacterium]|nr:hypothetical protein [Nitrospiraceae bacterium]
MNEEGAAWPDFAALLLHLSPHTRLRQLEECMEARKLDPTGHPPKRLQSLLGQGDEPFRWGLLARLIHPLIWVWIAALWLGLAWLVIFEAG